MEEASQKLQLMGIQANEHSRFYRGGSWPAEADSMARAERPPVC